MSKNIVEKNRKANEFTKGLISVLEHEGYTKAEMFQVFKLVKKKFVFEMKPNYE